MEITRHFKDFIGSGKSGGIVLVIATAISLILANWGWQQDYINFWHIKLGEHSIVHWINDGLMAFFFLYIGLKLEREIYHGELSDIKSASLPIFGALGGFLVPLGIYLLFNFGTNTQSGAGIPMATDIAFAIGILSLLGSKVPSSLKIFLTALAVIDDLGAILIIAVFYTSDIAFQSLLVALCVYGFLVFLNKQKIYHLAPYLIGGVVMWYFMLHSGVHATITGVLLAFVIPFGNGGKKTPSYMLKEFLSKPITFVVLPLFALANTCIPIIDGWQSGLGETYSVGIISGLVIGKPLGIWLFSLIGVALGFCVLPSDLNWKSVIGVGFLGGIGFTMSIFIALLAFDDEHIINNSKLAILIASLIAGLIGFIFLKYTLKSPKNDA